MPTTASSGDPSKYKKVPRIVEVRFTCLRNVGVLLLVVFAFILIWGDEIFYNGQHVTAITTEGLSLAKESKAKVEALVRGNLRRVKSRDSSEREDASEGGRQGKQEPEPAPEEPEELEASQEPTLDEWHDTAEAEDPAPPASMIDDPRRERDREKEAEGAAAVTEHEEEEEQVPPSTSKVAPFPTSDGADWSPAAPDTCSGFFGNGYSDFHTLLGPSEETGREPQLTCRQHPATTATLCFGRHMILRPDRITMSAGGESLQEVMGRSEEEEVPVWAVGASEFITAGYNAIPVNPATTSKSGEEEGGVSLRSSLPDPFLEGGSVHRADAFKAKQLQGAVKVDAREYSRTCAVRVKEPTIFLTRMEYANLFHTSTDWYNAWSAARMEGLVPSTGYASMLRKLTSSTAVARDDTIPRFPAHIVFLDGHNAGPMGDGWTALFLTVTYAKHFPGPACFDRPILAPFGYQAAISMGISPKRTSCANSKHVRSFGNDFVRGLNLSPREHSACADFGDHAGEGSAGGPVPLLFVRRVHYLAHPRHNGQIVRRLENEDDIVRALEERAAKGEYALSNGMFSSMSLREQVEVAQGACVIAGAHGAGLSHVLFAPPGVHMLEIQPPSFQRPHFIAYSTWSGAVHHLTSVNTPQPPVQDILSMLGQVVQAAVVQQRDEHERREGHGSPE